MKGAFMESLAKAAANAKAIQPAPAAVVNIPPNGAIHSLGVINSTMHIYNTGNPAGGNSTYNLTIVNVNNWMGVVIQQGHTDTYNPAGNAVYIQNNGPNGLQVLYV
jgi:hypothetical protein